MEASTREPPPQNSRAAAIARANAAAHAKAVQRAADAVAAEPALAQPTAGPDSLRSAAAQANAVARANAAAHASAVSGGLKRTGHASAMTVVRKRTGASGAEPGTSGVRRLAKPRDSGRPPLRPQIGAALPLEEQPGPFDPIAEEGAGPSQASLPRRMSGQGLLRRQTYGPDVSAFLSGSGQNMRHSRMSLDGSAASSSAGSDTAAPFSLPPIHRQPSTGAARVSAPLPPSRQRSISPLRAQMRVEMHRPGASASLGSSPFPFRSRLPAPAAVSLVSSEREPSSAGGEPDAGAAEAAPRPPRSGSNPMAARVRRPEGLAVEAPLGLVSSAREFGTSRDASPLRMRHKLDANRRPSSLRLPSHNTGKAAAHRSLPSPFKVSAAQWLSARPPSPGREPRGAHAGASTSSLDAPRGLAPPLGLSDKLLFAPSLLPAPSLSPAGARHSQKLRFPTAAPPLGAIGSGSPSTRRPPPLSASQLPSPPLAWRPKPALASSALVSPSHDSPALDSSAFASPPLATSALATSAAISSTLASPPLGTSEPPPVADALLASPASATADTKRPKPTPASEEQASSATGAAEEPAAATPPPAATAPVPPQADEAPPADARRSSERRSGERRSGERRSSRTSDRRSGERRSSRTSDRAAAPSEPEPGEAAKAARVDTAGSAAALPISASTAQDAPQAAAEPPAPDTAPTELSAAAAPLQAAAAADAPPAASSHTLPPTGIAPRGSSPPAAAVATEARAVDAEADLRPLLERLVQRYLPKAPAGSLQQRADETLMLLRCDWKTSQPVAAAAEAVERSLSFCASLAELAARQACLQGAVFQALANHHAAVERERIEREWAEEAAAEAAERAAEGADAAPLETEPSRIMMRSADGVRPRVEDGPLRGLGGAELLLFASGAVELRKSLRIKIEDDNDLETARRAFAECGHFVLLLRAEAAARGVGETELLRKLEMGEC